jgi:hypothetical protein
MAEADTTTITDSSDILDNYAQNKEAIVGTMTEQAGMATDDTGAPVAPSLPTGTEFEPVKQEVQEDELLDPKTVELDDVTTTAATASTKDLEIPVPTKTAANTYSAYTIPDTPEAKAAEGKLSAESIVGDIQGVVSKEAVAEAAQGTVSEKATVQYQIGELFKSFEEGKPAPAWAAPAVRQVGALMAKRGLGSSSMAAAATMQAIMESGIPIAQADAQTYATMDLANLNNRQAAALQNAATYAAMDRANLDARMKAAITNAQSFLSMDMANLNNEQRANEITHQSEVQAMLSDQAAVNAAAQFNAKSQNEVDQFFAKLETEIENSNANRLAAQEQFNVDQLNAMAQFNTSVNDSRERFETTMKAQIDASNTQWRRELNTANTALENEANRINAQNLLNLTVTAQNNLWQRYRDESAWIFQMSENAKQREHQIAMLNLQFAEDQSRYDQALEDQTARDLGKAAYNIIFG